MPVESLPSQLLESDKRKKSDEQIIASHFVINNEIGLYVKLDLVQKLINQLIEKAKLEQENRPYSLDECFDIGMKITFIICSTFLTITTFGNIKIPDQTAYYILGTSWNAADTLSAYKGVLDAREGIRSVCEDDAEGKLFFGRLNYTWSGVVMGGLTAFAAVEVGMKVVADASVKAVMVGAAGIVGLAMFLSGASFVGAMVVAALQSNWEADIAEKRAKDPSILLRNKINEYHQLTKQIGKINSSENEMNDDTESSVHSMSDNLINQSSNGEISEAQEKQNKILKEIAALSEKVGEEKYKYIEAEYNTEAKYIFTKVKEIKSDANAKNNEPDYMRAVRAERLVLEQYKIAAEKRHDARVWTGAAIGTAIGLVVCRPLVMVMQIVSSAYLLGTSLLKARQVANICADRNSNNLASDEQIREVFKDYLSRLIQHGEITKKDSQEIQIKKVEDEIIKQFIFIKGIVIYDLSSISSEDRKLIIDTQCAKEGRNFLGKTIEQKTALWSGAGKGIAYGSEVVAKAINPIVSYVRNSLPSIFGKPAPKAIEEIKNPIQKNR